MYVASEFGEEASKAKRRGRTIDNHANERKKKKQKQTMKIKGVTCRSSGWNCVVEDARRGAARSKGNGV